MPYLAAHLAGGAGGDALLRAPQGGDTHEGGKAPRRKIGVVCFGLHFWRIGTLFRVGTKGKPNGQLVFFPGGSLFER